MSFFFKLKVFWSNFCYKFSTKFLNKQSINQIDVYIFLLDKSSKFDLKRIHRCKKNSTHFDHYNFTKKKNLLSKFEM